jgi:hypothetical protein
VGRSRLDARFIRQYCRVRAGVRAQRPVREALAERHVQDDRLDPVVTSGGSAQIPALGFLHQLADADAFWTTAALVQVALMIALAVEARSAIEGVEAGGLRGAVATRHGKRDMTKHATRKSSAETKPSSGILH